MAERPKGLTAKDRHLLFALFGLAVVLFGFGVFRTWFSLHDQTATVVAVVIAVVLCAVLFIALPVGLYHIRCRQFVSSQMKLLRSPDVNVRLEAVSQLHLVGQGSTQIINSVREAHLNESAAWADQRLLDKFVLPGLATAAHDKDATVRTASLHALQEIGSWQALAIVAKATGRSL